MLTIFHWFWKRDSCFPKPRIVDSEQKYFSKSTDNKLKSCQESCRAEMWNKPGDRNSKHIKRAAAEAAEDSQVVLVVKNLPANAGGIWDMGLIPGSGRSPGGGHGNPLQYSCLEKQRSLEAYSPWGCKDSDRTEATQHAHTHTAARWALVTLIIHLRC